MAKRPRVGQRVTMRAPGKKPISFRAGGLHRSTGTPQGETIPASKVSAAASGSLGPRAKRQALFYRNVLRKGQRTARRHRGR